MDRAREATGRLPARDDDHPEESLMWRELLVRYDVRDVASVVFRDRFGCWAFLELWRIGSPQPYGDAEAEFLDAINDVVTTALRRCQAGTFARTMPTTTEGAGPVALVLSPELDVAPTDARNREVPSPGGPTRR